MAVHLEVDGRRAACGKGGENPIFATSPEGVNCSHCRGSDITRAWAHVRVLHPQGPLYKARRAHADEILALVSEMLDEWCARSAEDMEN
jgi:hypothetical protein